MEKRKVTVTIGGQRCSFYSDDSDTYISALEQRANEVMRQTARYSGASVQTNAILSVISLTDALMRAEKEEIKKPEVPAEIKRVVKKPAQPSEEGKGQVSVWDLLGEGNREESRR